MQFNEFLSEISLHNEVKEKVLDLVKDNYGIYLNYAKSLNDIALSEQTFEELVNIYVEDIYNYNILAIYLISAFIIYDKYKLKGISKKIYIDTMKCFSRFIDECYIKNGKYYFDRGFWTYRQTNMSLFRIGTLEFEFTHDKKISVHIPSDAVLTNEEIDKSFNELECFLNEFYPENKDYEIYCSSWLLSPELSKYLDSKSRILLFQKYFEIVDFNPLAMDVFEWVFKTNQNTPICDLKEETSLQKNIKKALLNGQKIGIGYGILKKK